MLPWTLVVAALFVLVSRIANLQPGYLYGLVLGTVRGLRQRTNHRPRGA